MPLVGPIATFNPNQVVLRPIIPVVLPPVVNYQFYENTVIPNEDDFKGITPFYPPQPPPAPPVTPAFVLQSAFGNTGAGSTTLSLPNNVTIGSILVFMIGAALTDNPGGPSTLGGNIWGPGAWTRFDSTQIVRYNEGIGGAGLAYWWKIADSTSAVGTIGVPNAAYGIYEIPNGNMALATMIFQTLQASTATMSIGSLPITASSVTLMIGDWADTDAGPPFTPPTWVPGSNWTKDSLYWFPGTGGRWHQPVIWIASGNGDPASGTRGPLSGFANGSWAGIAVVIPAL